MRIEVLGRVLDLGEKFEPEVSVKNPLFSTEGSQSIPLNFPLSPNNLDVLHYPNRLDRVENKNRLPINIHLEYSIKAGKLEVFSVSKSGIEATVYFDSGDFYSLVKNTQLNELNFGEIIDPYIGNFQEKTIQMLEHLMLVATSEIEADYQVFSVVADYDKEKKTAFILNETLPNRNNDEHFAAFESRTKVVDGVNITLPVGYGVTPFLKFHVLVDSVFKNFGYQLENNPFAEDPELKQLVILNNTADSVVRGTIDYRQLVPAIPVTDLIDILFSKFGLVLYVDSTERIARLVAIKDILNSEPDLELGDRLLEGMEICYENGMQLHLSNAKQDEPAFESLEELLKSYGSYGSFTLRSEEEFTTEKEQINNYNAIRLSTGDYYTIRTAPPGSDFGYFRHISSPYFNYVPAVPEGCEVKELASRDESITMDFPEIEGKSLRLYPMLGSGVGHYNSETRMNDGSVVEEKKNKLKLNFCFARGWAFKKDGTQEKYTYGSTSSYNNIGKPIPKFKFALNYLGEAGFYEHFFKEYEDFLRIGIVVECEILLQPHEIEQLDLSKPKRVHNQLFLIESIDYKLGGNKAKVRMWRI